MARIPKPPLPSSSALPPAEPDRNPELSQIRLYFIAVKPQSGDIFDRLGVEFEDEGYALSNVELDEAAGTEEISIYLDPEEVEATEARMRAMLDSVQPGIVVAREELGDVDWVAKSLEGLKPVRAGGFLVFGSHDRDAVKPTDIPIEIEAGLAFGTGHHGTTSGCLEMIAKVVAAEHPSNALDLGTGSAVLAIAIAKLGPIPVLATDIDDIATQVAAQNVALNGVSDHVEAITAEGFDNPIFVDRGPFALLVANILAGPLIALAPQMVNHVADGGSLILSGILGTQHDAVVAAYTAQGFRHIETMHRGEWVTLHLKP